MNEQEREDGRELRRALARLAYELYEATHALRNLSTCLMDDATGAYYEYGAPFGATHEAVRIWLTYRQFTTRN